MAGLISTALAANLSARWRRVIAAQRAADQRKRGARIPAEVGGIAVHAIRSTQAAGQLRLHRPQLHRVRARLDNRENSCAADGATQPLEGICNRGGVVCEVVVYRDPIDGSDEL